MSLTPSARLIRLPSIALLALIGLSGIQDTHAQIPDQVPAGVEQVTLSERNFDDYVPMGKEVDAIYGDIVLRNEKIVAVIAQPSKTRNANMTVRDVGGSVIDLTARTQPNDQLSCFYPGADRIRFHDPDGVNIDSTLRALSATNFNSVSITISGKTVPSGRPATVTYELETGDSYLTVTTTVTNDRKEPFEFSLPDSIRADRTFVSSFSSDGRLISFYDQWFHQAYGVYAAGDFRKIIFKNPKNDRKMQWTYRNNHEGQRIIPPGESYTWTRYLYPAKDTLELETIANQIRVREGETVRRVKTRILVRDTFGPVANAKVSLAQNQKTIGFSTTDGTGVLNTELSPGEYEVVVTADGRPKTKSTLVAEGYSIEKKIELASLGYVESHITDGVGNPIACKVAFIGLNGTPDPNFGPDSRAVSVKNLRYSANGRFKQGIGPGKYEVIVSHGPEYDAEILKLEVVSGKITNLSTQLKRSVDTTGWISADFHSHSSESGDNTSDQLGRVLNLLAEQFDFRPAPNTTASTATCLTSCNWTPSKKWRLAPAWS